jgi:hypothetical protein
MHRTCPFQHETKQNPSFLVLNHTVFTHTKPTTGHASGATSGAIGALPVGALPVGALHVGALPVGALLGLLGLSLGVVPGPGGPLAHQNVIFFALHKTFDLTSQMQVVSLFLTMSRKHFSSSILIVRNRC